MPSPFPGMDPYLEDPRLWPDVHHELLSVIRARLTEAIRPAYFVQVEERVYISGWDDPGVAIYVPDVQIAPTERQPDRSTTAIAVIDEPIILNVDPVEVHESYLEIVDARSREVVTVIEVLSPSNKTPGSLSRKLYLEKRETLLATPTQLVEIDLLRRGQRTFSGMPLLKCDYLARASVRSDASRSKAWPMRLSERLKTIGIPLKEGDPDAPLDLQAVLNTVYDRAGYDLVIDYRKPCDPPLTPEQVTWAKDVVAQAAGTKA
jgi:hypothetical protein